jgi:hypothetical protein
VVPPVAALFFADSSAEKRTNDSKMALDKKKKGSHETVNRVTMEGVSACCTTHRFDFRLCSFSADIVYYSPMSCKVMSQSHSFLNSLLFPFLCNGFLGLSVALFSGEHVGHIMSLSLTVRDKRRWTLLSINCTSSSQSLGDTW